MDPKINMTRCTYFYGGTRTNTPIIRKSSHRVHPIALEKKRLQLKNQQKPVKNLKSIDSSWEMLPGVQHIFKSQNMYCKCMWSFIVILSICVCLYQILDRYQWYNSQPTNSKVLPIPTYKVKFPAFTFCPIFGKYLPLVKEAEELFGRDKFSDKYCNITFEEIVDLKNSDPLSIWRKMSLEMEISAEQIQFISVDPYITIKEIHFAETLTEFGKCVTYFIPNLQPISVNSRIRVHIATDRNPCSKTKVESHALYRFYSDDETMVYKAKNIIAIVPDEYLMYELSIQKYHLVNTTNDICISAEESSNCRKECIEQILKKNLTCRLPFMKSDHLPLCKTGIQLKETQTKVIYQVQTASFKCSCYKPCDKFMYNRNLVASRKASGNFSMLDFYFGNNYIITFDEYINYTFISLLCDIGGNLGLYLGLCILTLVDIIQAIIFTSIRCIHHKN